MYRHPVDIAGHTGQHGFCADKIIDRVTSFESFFPYSIHTLRIRYLRFARECQSGNCIVHIYGFLADRGVLDVSVVSSSLASWSYSTGGGGQNLEFLLFRYTGQTRADFENWSSKPRLTFSGEMNLSPNPVGQSPVQANVLSNLKQHT